MTGLNFNLEGKHCCAFTGGNAQLGNQSAQRNTGFRRVYARGRICVRRYDHLFSLRQEEPFNTGNEIGCRRSLKTLSGMGQRQGFGGLGRGNMGRCENKKIAGCGSRHGSADTAKPAGEGRSGAETHKYLNSTAHEVPLSSTMRELPLELPLVKRAARRRLWRTPPRSRMQINIEHAANLIRLRIPPGPPTKGNAVLLAGMVLSAPPMFVDFARRVRHAVNEILAMSWGVMGIYMMVQALERRHFCGRSATLPDDARRSWKCFLSGWYERRDRDVLSAERRVVSGA